MSIYNTFKTDSDLEMKGIVIDYGKDGKFIIRRAGGANREFTKTLEAKTRPYRRQIEMGTLDATMAESLLIEAFVDTVLIGWEGVKNVEEVEIKFSKKAAVELLTDLPELFADLREKAFNAANFLMGDVEGDIKN